MVADAVRLPTERVVATIQAPTSTDAEGADVPSTLSVSGNTVTLHVEHQDHGFSYPIAADPVIVVHDNGFVTHCCLKVPTAYTGLFWGTWSIQNLPSFFFGFDNYANGLWAVNFWGQWRLVYNAAISPVLIGVPVDPNNPPWWAIMTHAIWTAPAGRRL